MLTYRIILFPIFIFMIMAIGIDYCSAEMQNGQLKGSILYVDVEKDILTVDVKNGSLKTVLNEISKRSNINIILHDDNTKLVTANFFGLSLIEGIKRLIGDSNYAITFNSKSDSSFGAKINDIIVVPKNGNKINVRMEADDTFSKINPDTDLDSIFTDLHSKNAYTREDAVDSLAEFKDFQHIAIFKEILLRDKDNNVRGSAAMALANFNSQLVIDHLIEGMKDEDSWVRECVVEAFLEIGGKEVLAPLNEALQDQNEEVRQSAIDALEVLQQEKNP